MDGYFKNLRVQAFVGIRRADLDPLIPQSVLTDFSDALAASTELEPLYAGLIDQGFNTTNTPRILALEAAHIQIDASLNEISRATCVLASGRDGTRLDVGADDRTAASVAHLIERYLGGFVPVRVYARLIESSTGATAADFGDILPESGEWQLLFEGFSTGPTRRGSPTSYAFVLHLTHRTGRLTFSSSLSANVAAGTQLPFALSPFLYPPESAPVAGFGWTTPAGMTAATLAGGPGLYTDFWGYDVPARTIPPGFFGRALGSGTVLPPARGLKQFLRNLAQGDLFDWAKFSAADRNATNCPDYPLGNGRRRNDRALEALDSLEPFAGVGTSDELATAWADIESAIRHIRQVRQANGSTAAIDRGALLGVGGVDPATYKRVGYRYAMPVAFYLNQTALGPFGTAAAMAFDIAGSTFHDLAPASFWELLASRYGPRYQLAFAPTAAGGAVLPFQPLLDRFWQTIYASEVFSWDDDVRTPIPVRGVVLLSNRRSDAGFPAGVQSSDPQGLAAATTADAAYDSCEDGVFLYRASPSWLQTSFRNPAPYTPRTVDGARASSAVPWSTAPAAAKALAATITSLPVAAGKTYAAACAAMGIPPAAPTAPPETMRSTSNRLAKAYFQQARTQHRSASVTGRFRTDIAPGSLLRLELPGDRYVKKALTGGRDTVGYGIVLRMTISLSAESRQAATAYQIGFFRTEGDAAPGSVLFADTHAYWATATLGLPWADTISVRNRLGNKADINFRPPGVPA